MVTGCNVANIFFTKHLTLNWQSTCVPNLFQTSHTSEEAISDSYNFAWWQSQLLFIIHNSGHPRILIYILFIIYIFWSISVSPGCVGWKSDGGATESWTWSCDPWSRTRWCVFDVRVISICPIRPKQLSWFYRQTSSGQIWSWFATVNGAFGALVIM